MLIPGGDGINIGIAQPVTPDAHHSGGLNGTETPAITESWVFTGNTGTNATNNANGITVHGANTLDFSGWSMAWSGIESPLGGVADFGDSGLATIVCSTAGVCADGDSYTLDYSAHFQEGDPTSLGGILYNLHLEGFVSTPPVSTVPVPAAAWLFGSGLLGLVGVARRKPKV